MTGANRQTVAADETIYWDGQGLMYRGAEPPSHAGPALSAAPRALPLTHAAGEARRLSAPRPQTQPRGTAGERHDVPTGPTDAMDWETLAAYVTFYLDPRLLRDRSQDVHLGARGELVWVYREENAASGNPAVCPAVLVHAPSRGCQTARTAIVPHFPAGDPLRQHLVLVLQAMSTAADTAERVYAEVLTNALAVHFLRRYAATKPTVPVLTGGLLPYKLRRTITYIQGHLAQELSLATLAAVAQTSPAHFARLFKHATGLAPHQYVIRCRMGHARRLLAETDVSLIDIGLQVGCADQSHFTVLFRTHVAQTPKAFRDHARRA